MSETPSRQNQIALVSEQAMPTLIAAYVFRPEFLYLLSTPAMAERSRWLKEILSPKGIKVRIERVFPYDIDGIREKCLKLAGENANLALNATGGTKIMAFGAYQAFIEKCLPVFYVDMANGLIRHLTRNGTDAISGKISIRDYLHAYGFEVESGMGLNSLLPNKRAVGVLDETLVKSPGLIAEWNHGIGEAARGVKTNNPRIRKTLERLSELGYGTFDGGTYQCGETLGKYLLGPWFEDVVFHEISALKPDDIMKSVVVRWLKGKGETRNEFDVLFTRDFKLYYISCKTGDMMGEYGKARTALYELEALKDKIAGLFGKAMLITLKRLNGADTRRAAKMGIRVVQGREAANLRGIAGAWMQENRAGGTP